MRKPLLLALGVLAVSTLAATVLVAYDPAADAWAQVQAAGERASASRKRVLLVVGGDW